MVEACLRFWAADEIAEMAAVAMCGEAASSRVDGVHTAETTHLPPCTLHGAELLISAEHTGRLLLYQVPDVHVHVHVPYDCLV